MVRIITALDGAALALILGGALLADSIVNLHHGFFVLFAIMGAAGALVFIGDRLEYKTIYGSKGGCDK
jgi:hypothetical protein